MFSGALTLCEKISLHPGYPFQQRESWHKIISSCHAISLFFFSILFRFRSLPQGFLCDSQIHYAFLILILLPKDYGRPLPDIDNAAVPVLEWIISRADCKQNFLLKYLVLHLTLKKVVNLFRRKRAILSGSRMPKPGHLIFYMLKTVIHVNIENAHQTPCKHTRRMYMFPYRVFIKKTRKNKWTTLG